MTQKNIQIDNIDIDLLRKQLLWLFNLKTKNDNCEELINLLEYIIDVAEDSCPLYVHSNWAEDDAKYCPYCEKRLLK